MKKTVTSGLSTELDRINQTISITAQVKLRDTFKMKFEIIIGVENQI